VGGFVGEREERGFVGESDRRGVFEAEGEVGESFATVEFESVVRREARSFAETPTYFDARVVVVVGVGFDRGFGFAEIFARGRKRPH
jgi:hypothetical protein